MRSIHIDLPKWGMHCDLRRVTVLSGDSGTGKTYFCEVLQQLIDGGLLKNVLVCDSMGSLDSFLNVCEQDALIVLDKMEQMNNIVEICEKLRRLVAAKEIYLIVCPRGYMPFGVTLWNYASVNIEQIEDKTIFTVEYQVKG